MITIPIKFNNQSDLKEIAVLIQENIWRFTSSEYLHFYNLKSLFERIQKKIINYIPTKSKKCSLNLNINELNSLSALYYNHLGGLLSNPFITALMESIIRQYHPYIITVIHHDKLNFKQPKQLN